MIACRRSLLFRLGFLLLQLCLVKADPLKTLKKYSACISPCFETCDPDYDAACVCNLLNQDSDSVNATVTCISQYCDPEFAAEIFPDFGRECSIFLKTPIIYNGAAIQTLPIPTPSATVTPTSTYLLELTPTATAAVNTTSAAAPSSTQPGVVIPAVPSTQGAPRPLVAVYVLVPIVLVVILVAIFYIWRRKSQRKSFDNSTGWDSSQNPIIERPMNTRGGGDSDGDGDRRFTIRVVPRSISQAGTRTPSPLQVPPPARKPSLGRRAKDFARRLIDKELPGLPLNLSITTISEVSEVPKLPERDARTHRTTDSEDELRRVFREVRKGFRSQSTASSAVTSMDWSMVGGTSIAGASQVPGAKGPGS